MAQDNFIVEIRDEMIADETEGTGGGASGILLRPPKFFMIFEGRKHPTASWKTAYDELGRRGLQHAGIKTKTIVRTRVWVHPIDARITVLKINDGNTTQFRVSIDGRIQGEIYNTHDEAIIAASEQYQQAGMQK